MEEQTTNLHEGSEKKRQRKKIEEVPLWKKTTLTIEEASAYSNIGINKMLEITKDPRCSFVLHIGQRRLVKRELFEQFITETLEI